MSCPYYQEPEAGKLIGCCNGNPTKIPSEIHQDCLCRSLSGNYARFCPIHAKFERSKAYTHRRGILKRIFVDSYRKLIYNDEIEV